MVIARGLYPLQRQISVGMGSDSLRVYFHKVYVQHNTLAGEKAMGANRFFPIVDFINQTSTDDCKIDRLILLHDLAEKGIIRRAYKLKNVDGAYSAKTWFNLEDISLEDTCSHLGCDIVNGIMAN